MRLQHKELGIDVETGEILTRHVEGWFREQRELTGSNEVQLSGVEYCANVLRAACRAEIITSGLDEGGVDELAPAATLWLARKVDEVLAEALTVPGE
jgi:hypothetical protein